MADTTTPNAAESIQVKVAETLKGIAPKVEAKVIEALVDRELNKRADAITKGLDKLARLRQEGYKINKPDVITYNSDGSTASATFTKDALKKIEEHTKELTALTNALNAAIEKADFAKLYEKVNA